MSYQPYCSPASARFGIWHSQLSLEFASGLLRVLAARLCVVALLVIGSGIAVAYDRPDQSLPADRTALEQRVAQLIEQLGNENYHTRVNARWELERIGLAAFGQLREAVNHSNIQVANVARYLVQSQNVTWWLDTDSVDVRRLLLDYNSLDVVDRDTRLQELAVSGSEDALIALCRLARFESNERLSKSAALYLMEHLASQRGASSDSLSRSILLTIDQSNRPAAEWLRTVANELQSGQTDLAAWSRSTAAEAELARQTADIDSQIRALRFYKWAGDWLTLRTNREQALTIARKSLELVANNPYSLREFSHWAVDAQLPELVIELAAAQPQAFSSEPQLGYLLAESHLRNGDRQLADTLAEQASLQIDAKAEQIRSIQPAGFNDMLANRRIEVAMEELASRGLYDWAEKEFQRAIELPTTQNMQRRARSMFAEFYWSGGEFRKAADVLKPLAEGFSLDDQDNLPGPFNSGRELAAFHLFYSGLAAIADGDLVAARERLVQSNQLYPNPDVVIAMKSIADEEPMRSVFEEHFAKMAEDYRVSVASHEKALAEAPDRMTRASVASNLASACNQLAWLLSKCETSPEEAINLSWRSLEFSPSEPAFLDTLGRCYFAAGKFSDAVAAQEQAVAAAPYDRMMRVQLAQFQEALKKRQSVPQAQP